MVRAVRRILARRLVLLALLLRAGMLGGGVVARVMSRLGRIARLIRATATATMMIAGGGAALFRVGRLEADLELDAIARAHRRYDSVRVGTALRRRVLFPAHFVSFFRFSVRRKETSWL